MVVHVARVYDSPPPDGGARVLVDRLWPRGVRKDAGIWDLWMPEVAPSTALRLWFGHDPSRYQGFRERYLAELQAPSGVLALQRLGALGEGGRLVLLTATADLRHSAAAVLREVLGGPSPP